MNTNDAWKNHPIDAWWQTVPGIDTHSFLVYSAFYDKRDIKDPVIRVIGITRKTNSESVKCRLYGNNTGLYSPFVDITAEIVIVPLQQIRSIKYHDCHVLCHLNLIPEISSESVPESVSIISLSMGTPNKKREKNKQKLGRNKRKLEHNLKTDKLINRLPVINAKNDSTRTFRKNLGMCIKPLHSNYNKIIELITFFEFNKILGISKFTVYTESVSDGVKCVLDYYETQGNLVLEWNLPSRIAINRDIYHRAALSALNDCIYRNMNEFDYLVQIDVDEFIIPRMQESIPEMLMYLEKHVDHIKGEELSYEQKIAHNLINISSEDQQIHNPKQLMLRNNPSWANPNLVSSYNFQNAYFYLGFGEIVIIYYKMQVVSFRFLYLNEVTKYFEN